jgi:hypothetical protein
MIAFGSSPATFAIRTRQAPSGARRGELAKRRTFGKQSVAVRVDSLCDIERPAELAMMKGLAEIPHGNTKLPPITKL